MNFLSYTGVEISLTKCRNFKKEKWINIGRNKQQKADSRSHDVAVYLYTKYEHFILNGSGDIFVEKVLRN